MMEFFLRAKALPVTRHGFSALKGGVSPYFGSPLFSVKILKIIIYQYSSADEAGLTLNLKFE